MPLKMTLKMSGQDVILEGDALDVVTAYKALADGPPSPSEKRPTPRVKFDGEDDEPDSGRAPRGENKKFALQALAGAGNAGLRQAHVAHAIAASKGEIAISSVRHALHQLKDDGWARVDDDIWKITNAGLSALAKMEAA